MSFEVLLYPGLPLADGGGDGETKLINQVSDFLLLLLDDAMTQAELRLLVVKLPP